MAKSVSKKLVIFLFIFFLLVLFIKIKTFFNFYDEGFAMFGSTRVLNGDFPYKDFWAIYPPGQFYLVAAVMKLFGPGLLNARIYDTLVRFLLVIGVYLVARRITYQKIALLAALITTFLLASAGFYSYAVFPAMTLGLWSIWFCLVYADHGHRRWLLLAGVLLGVAAIIRWDIGIYAAISALAGSYVAMLALAVFPNSPTAPRPPLPRMLFDPIRRLLWLVAPMLGIGLVGYGLIGLQSGWTSLYQQVFYFPTSVLHSVRWLPYPSLIPSDLIVIKHYYEYPYPEFNFPSEDWFRFYLPILTLGMSIGLLVVAYVKNRASLNKASFAILSLTIFGALLFNQALSRYDLIHVIPASILTFMVAGGLIQQFSSLGKKNRVRNTLYGIVICLFALYFAPSLKELLVTLDTAAPWGCYSTIKIAGCVTLQPDEEQAADFIQASTQPIDRIFVGNQKHDRIFVNDIGLYYLAGRMSGTRFHELYPGVATTLPVQTEIAHEIETNGVKWIALVKIWDSTEPNGSALSSGVTYLDDFLHSNYSEVAEFGNYQIWKKIN